ncbi:hypothetical protein ACU686_16470 [Yinghuangia aomiensis]
MADQLAERGDVVDPRRSNDQLRRHRRQPGTAGDPDPDRYDITRRAMSTLTFGDGPRVDPPRLRYRSLCPDTKHASCSGTQNSSQRGWCVARSTDPLLQRQA